MEKRISDQTSHYNDLQNKIFDFRNVKFPGKKKTKVINVFEPDHVFSDEGMMPIKSAGSTKVGRC